MEYCTSPQYPRPVETLILLDIQDCPQCRKVREALSILDLDVLFKPCSRTQASSVNVNAPSLHDPNSGLHISGGDHIVAYLFRTYGNNRVPFLLRPGLLGDLTAAWAMRFRSTSHNAADTPPGTQGEIIPLELWAYEASPFCAVVREALSAAGLPHLQHSVARGSPNRQALFERRGHFQAPYLEDPNTGIAMFESAAIVEYIRKNYGGAIVNETDNQ
jgi:glutathione S-transferase